MISRYHNNKGVWSQIRSLTCNTDIVSFG